jgi:SAM-dependent methyltransferase
VKRRRFVAAVGAAAALLAAPAARPQAVAPASPRAPDVPYEPSPPAVVKAMLELANVGRDDVVYDLGSGDGRIVIAAARDFGARAVGIDIDPKRIAESNANAQAAGVGGRVRFVEGDLFTSDFREATVVTLFLWPHINLKLRPQLEQLKPGTRIVSHIHDLGDWTPDRTVRVRVEGENRTRTLYLWIVRGR